MTNGLGVILDAKPDSPPSTVDLSAVSGEGNTTEKVYAVGTLDRIFDRMERHRALRSLVRSIRRYGNGYSLSGYFIYSGETAIGYVNLAYYAPRVEIIDSNVHWKLREIIPEDFIIECREQLRKSP